jgi:predicted nucleic acid-binding protein
VGTYFLDTSAIVKRYCLERGQSWVRGLCNPLQDHVLFISQAALVEVVTAFCRKAYLRDISISQRDDFIYAFRTDCENTYIIEPVTDAIYTAAGNLCRMHNLRAYDAVQLTCALNICEEALADQTPLPIFVCADKRLIEFACAEGLAADNPENHPFHSEAE